MNGIGGEMRAWFRDLVSQGQKNHLTLEHLQQLSTDLQKHVEQSKTEAVVEDVRQITELVIWGDKHNPAFFDYFLEKNILGQILDLLGMPHTPKVVKVQIIQTLSMLINNITNDTAVYFILSNNHINELITHEFDFNDLDYMSYWISFVKGLSLKLNEHTVQFFFNAAKQTFPLFTEAVRHFRHPESMVRIAVRTLTLKVFNVPDPGMRRYVLKVVTSHYFPTFAAHLAQHSRDLATAASTSTASSHGKLDQQAEELIDMFYYLADIYAVDFPELIENLTNIVHEVLVTPLLQAALPGLPSILQNPIEAPRIGAHLVYFILAQFILAIRHPAVLATTIGQLLNPVLNVSVSSETQTARLEAITQRLQPSRDQESSGHTGEDQESSKQIDTIFDEASDGMQNMQNPYREAFIAHLADAEEEYSLPAMCLLYIIITNRTISNRTLAATQILPRKYYNEVAQLRMLTEESEDDSPVKKPPDSSVEKLPAEDSGSASPVGEPAGEQFEGAVEAVVAAVVEAAVPSSTPAKPAGGEPYPEAVVDRLLMVLQTHQTCRLITLQVAIHTLMVLIEPRVESSAAPLLLPQHMELVAQAHSSAVSDLRNKMFGTMGDTFLDMFDDEVYAMQDSMNSLSMERLAQNTFVVLPLVQSPVPGLDLSKRLPATDSEQTRKSIQVYLTLRALKLQVECLGETLLPLKRCETEMRLDESLDLTNEDVIACGVKTTASQRPVPRYLVVDNAFMVLVEPDQTRIGWAVVRAVHPLMSVDAKMTRTADNRVLQVAVRTSKTQQEVMHLVFDDHIRCLAARQHLERGRTHVRAKMMDQVMLLLYPEGREAEGPSGMSSAETTAPAAATGPMP